MPNQQHHHKNYPPKGLPYRSIASLMLIGLVVLGLALWAVFKLPRILAEIRYPLKYENLIVAQSEARNLDPFLVAAIIYTESRFNPHATSHADARGLMQIAPATGIGIAKRIGDSNFSLQKLYDPTTNVRYGTFHLQGLMSRYEYKSIDAALVAYNGGGEAGDRYLRGERASVPRESLNYVKKVNRAWNKYKELYPHRLVTQKALEETLTPRDKTTIISKILDIIRDTLLEKIRE